MKLTLCQYGQTKLICCTSANEHVNHDTEQCECNDGYTRNSAGECEFEGDCPDGYEMDILSRCVPIDDGVDLTPPDDRDIGNSNEVLWVDDEDLPGAVDCSPPCRRKQYMGKKYCDCNP